MFYNHAYLKKCKQARQYEGGVGGFLICPFSYIQTHRGGREKEEGEKKKKGAFLPIFLSIRAPFGEKEHIKTFKKSFFDHGKIIFL